MFNGLVMVTAFTGVIAVGAAVAAQSARKAEETLSDRVAPNADEVHPILVGMKVPDVTLTEVDGKPVRLYSFLEKNPTVLVFYRGGWCPYCNLQLSGLHDIESKVLQLGYQLVAVSADRPMNVEKSIEKHELNFTSLSDSDKVAAKAFGLAFKVNEKTLESYKKFGINLTEASGVDDHVLPVPAVFIVGTDGTILFEYVNPNYKVRLNAQVLLAILRAENEESRPGK